MRGLLYEVAGINWVIRYRDLLTRNKLHRRDFGFDSSTHFTQPTHYFCLITDRLSRIKFIEEKIEDLTTSLRPDFYHVKCICINLSLNFVILYKTRYHETMKYGYIVFPTNFPRISPKPKLCQTVTETEERIVLVRSHWIE